MSLDTDGQSDTLKRGVGAGERVQRWLQMRVASFLFQLDVRATLLRNYHNAGR